MNKNVNSQQNAIRQSHEFKDLGKHEHALEVLLEALKGRRVKGWNSTVEVAMKDLLDLCLTLLNVHALKDAILQYRILCQNINIESFTNVILAFMAKAVEACRKARSQSREQVLAEDLDAIETPETVLLKSISETTQQDRTDRVLLSPILRFTWEGFRGVLETCKNNRNLEKLYTEIAKRSFDFLQTYERKTEFRKLCDVTKSHLLIIVKYTQNQFSINLSDPSSLDFQLEIRLAQLNTAIVMDLWAEAFKTMEDIHYLLLHSKKTPHPKILAIFYQKISLVFEKVNAPLFHAIALNKLFILVKEHKKGFKPEELMRISSRVLAAAISIPFSYDRNVLEVLLFRFSDQACNMSQLSHVLGLSHVPTRRSVLEDVIKTYILQYSNVHMTNVFNALQNPGEHPLLCEYLSEQLALIPNVLEDDLAPYIDAIKKNTFLVFLRRLSKFYEFVHMDILKELSNYYNKDQILAILLECSRNSYLKLVIDDETQIVKFETRMTPSMSSMEESESGYNIFDNVMAYFVKQVYHLGNVIDRQVLTQEYHKLVSEYQSSVLQQKEIDRYAQVQEEIIRYSERVNRENQEASRQNFEKMEEERTRMKKLESVRLEEERVRREEERAERDNREKELLQKREQVTELVNSGFAKKIFKDVKPEELESNPDKFLHFHNEVRGREMMVHVKRLKNVEKFVEVYNYVIRQTEKPKMELFITAAPAERLKEWKRIDENYLTLLKKTEELNEKRKAYFCSIQQDIDDFVVVCQEIAKHAHQEMLKEHNELVQKERLKLLAKRKAERIHKRKLECIAELRKKYDVRQELNRGDAASASRPPVKDNVYKPPPRNQRPDAHPSMQRQTFTIKTRSNRPDYFS